jgi:tyrosine-protein kinase
MDLKRYARVLRAHWALVSIAVLACTVAAGVLALTRDPVYEARAQMFVSAASSPSDRSPSETYQGGLFSQQRTKSYASVVSSPPVARAVAAQLGLDPQAVQSQIRATVVEGTVLIDVTVRAGSARQAKAIADGVTEQFPKFVNELDSSQAKISVTSPARLPTSPVSPNKDLYLLLGCFLGLVLGVGGAVLREILDRRIRGDEDASAIAGAPVLGRIAHDPATRTRPLVVVDDPDSSAAEAYRRLRTSLRVLGMDQGLRSFVVSSAVAAEGKTLIVANLGLAIAQAGATVVLVDADMRRPKLASTLGLESTVGLSDVLTGGVPVETALHRHGSLPLEVLTAGTTPPRNPSELLGSERCAAMLDTLTDRADVVLCNAPALLAVSDAAALARLVAAVILVVRVPTTRADQFDAATATLRSAGRQPLGIVLYGVPTRQRWPYGNGRQPAAEESLSEEIVWTR